jgi:hypothetical protein
LSTHYDSIEDLIADAPRSGPLGGDDIKSSRKVYAFLRYAGTVWAVHEDCRAERLVELGDYLDAGLDPIRCTDRGT